MSRALHGVRRVNGALLTHLTNRIDVVPRSGTGRRHVLPLRPGHARNFDWQKALCGARPRSGWSTAVPDGAPSCISCQQQLVVEAEVAESRVWTAEEAFRSAQVAGVLRDEITSGRFLPGRRFLTQTEVKARFGVSNVTARRVWGLLKAQGLIVAEQGYRGGTYATSQTARPGR